jgi:hypothetical protein
LVLQRLGGSLPAIRVTASVVRRHAQTDAVQPTLQGAALAVEIVKSAVHYQENLLPGVGHIAALHSEAQEHTQNEAPVLREHVIELRNIGEPAFGCIH